MPKTAKKSTSGWGGKREGAGAKRILPPGARTRSIKMTDGEFEKVKIYLSKLRGKNENRR